jgi:hypothetical protein
MLGFEQLISVKQDEHATSTDELFLFPLTQFLVTAVTCRTYNLDCRENRNRRVFQLVFYVVI